MASKLHLKIFRPQCNGKKDPGLHLGFAPPRGMLGNFPKKPAIREFALELGIEVEMFYPSSFWYRVDVPGTTTEHQCYALALVIEEHTTFYRKRYK